MKQIFRVITALMIGCIIGLLIGSLVSICFTDATFSSVISNFSKVDIGEVLAVFAVAVAGLFVSAGVLITLHEAGHLVCGLLCGYRFVSFRIFSLTILKINKRFRFKRFSIAGTGGQCLLCPPDRPASEIKTGWYNFGGVLANIIIIPAAIPLFYISPNAFFTEFLAIFLMIDVFMALFNGIPMKINGMGNDGYNMLVLRKNPETKNAFIIQLRANALIQQGVRPKDMPAEWFNMPEEICYRNPMELTIPLMTASRLEDNMQWESAYRILKQIYDHKDQIIGLYVKEIACELIFLALVTDRKTEAETILEPQLMKYINTTRRVMSSKERILCAIELFINDDHKAAEEIYQSLLHNRKKYLLQGEVESDIELTKYIIYDKL